MDSSLIPARQVKRVKIDNYSEDQQTIQQVSNTNLNELFKKIEKLNEATNNIQALMNVLQGQMKLVSEALAENKVLINKCLRQTNEDDSLLQIFPIETEERLIEIENKIHSDNRKQYIKAMRSLLEPAGVQKNLRRILGDNVIMAYNVEGVQGKKSLKEHTELFGILLEAVSLTNTNSVGPPDEHVRKALQVQKRRIFKNMSLARKSTFSN